MTTEPLYKEFLEAELVNYVESEKLRFSYFDTELVVDDNSLSDVIDKLHNWQSSMQALENVTISEFVPNVRQKIIESFSPDIDHYRERMAGLVKEYTLREKQILRNKELLIVNARAAIDEYNHRKLMELTPLLQAHAELKAQRTDIEDIFRLYGIPSDEFQLNTKTLTYAELKEMIIESRYAVRTVIGTHTIFQKGAAILYLPAIYHLPNPENDLIFRVAYTVAFLALCYLFKPYFIAAVGLFYIATIFANLSKIRERRELLQIAYCLTDDIDLKQFITNTDEYNSLHDKLLAVENRDISSEIAENKKLEESAIAELSKSNPQNALDAELTAWSTYVTTPTCMSQINKAFVTIQMTLSHLKDVYSVKLDKYTQYIKYLGKNAKFLGTEISMSKVLSNDMRLGCTSFDGIRIQEPIVKYPKSNVLFKYRNDESRNECIAYMKLLLCNFICNVKEKYLDITILDSDRLGIDFSEFINLDTEPYIHIITKDCGKVIDTFFEESTKRVRTLGNVDVNTYNVESEKVGKVTVDYKLLIVLSSDTDLVSKKQFWPWLKYCQGLGILCWILGKDPELMTTQDDQTKRQQLLDCYSILCTCSGYGNFVNDVGSIIDRFDNYTEPYRYTRKLGKDISDLWSNTMKDNRSEILDYKTGYQEKVIPDDKVWTYDTLNGIELRFGYVDGDPSKPHGVTLGDDTVHALMGGTTGSGKSATINFILANLLLMYPPEELELIMVDFKNTEFGIYTGPCLIPHAKIIAGTEDGEYALSIFEYALDEMHRRQKLCASVKARNIVEYNNYMIANNRLTEKLPRILCLVDEFQQMFFVSDRILDKIKSMITQLSKLARAFGFHMFFASQSMTGTMPQDVLDQFKLRAALGSTQDTSVQLIGNKEASLLKGKGWIITNSTGGQNPKANVLWRVPFIPTNYVKEYVPKLVEKVAKEGRLNRLADFYDESKIFPESKLNGWLNSPEIKRDERVFIAGERTSYSTNKAPANFRIIKDDNEHLILSGFERTSLANLTLTIASNIKSKSNTDLVIHCCDSEFRTLLDLKKLVTPERAIFLEREVTPELVIAFLEKELDYRRKHKEEQFEQLYVILLSWDKAQGIGRSENYGMQDRLKAVLQDAGLLDVHIILAVKEFKVLRTVFSALFNHRLCSYSTPADSNALIDSERLCKLKPEFAIYQYGSTDWKCKIYNFEMNGTVESREVVLA